MGSSARDCNSSEDEVKSRGAENNGKAGASAFPLAPGVSANLERIFNRQQHDCVDSVARLWVYTYPKNWIWGRMTAPVTKVPAIDQLQLIIVTERNQWC